MNEWWRNMRWCALAICKTSCEYQASVSVAVAMSSRLRLRGSRVNAYESGGGTGLMLLCRETKGRKGGRQTGRDEGRKKAGQPSSNDGWPARIPCGRAFHRNDSPPPHTTLFAHRQIRRCAGESGSPCVGTAAGAVLTTPTILAQTVCFHRTPYRGLRRENRR